MFGSLSLTYKKMQKKEKVGGQFEGSKALF